MSTAPTPQKPAKQAATPVVIHPVASATRLKTRHWGLLVSFVLLVIAPICIAAYYLYARAEDQYASTLGFTVRSEDYSPATSLLGGLGLGSSSGSDTDILYEFIRSQELVRAVDAELNLRELYSRYHDTDPLLSFAPGGTIEDLLGYWHRMVRISYDASTGLIELQTLAFTPEDAQAIANAIYDQSTLRINELSAIARNDATRYAQEDLDLAIERLIASREAMTDFRLRTQIVDPDASLQGQVGLLNTLQTQLAEALIAYDLIQETVRAGDPRIEQAQLRISVINARIDEERQRFGSGGGESSGEDYATIVAEFERLTVDREFAEQAYTTALAAFDAARAEAQRQSRYLAAYIRPTLAEQSEYPQRLMILGLTALFSFLAWSIMALIFYSLRDRK